jgi:hypothetical protein
LPYYSYGLQKTGEPWGLTFIARPYQEDTLLKMDLPLNKQQKIRKLPEDYKYLKVRLKHQNLLNNDCEKMPLIVF